MQVDPSHFRNCWVLAGPTAVGKTALSLSLAQELNAEIISMDSMAIYRGMDIGTAKPSLEEQAQVPHHLIDVVDPHESFSTAEYLEQSAEAVSQIESRDKIALFVGGTGLYLRSLLRGVFVGPDADWDLRKELEAVEQENPGELYRRLQQCDPDLAQKLHPNDQRRIVRGLEVWQLTGEPLSKQQQQASRSQSERASHVFWLHRSREELYERINLRVDQMIEEGLVEEVRGLLQRNPPISRTALQGLGYKEVAKLIEEQGSIPETADEIKTRSRQFAKRQHTWFRNLEECEEIVVTSEDTVATLIEKIKAE